MEEEIVIFPAKGDDHPGDGIRETVKGFSPFDYLNQQFKDGSILAVTGGTTLAEVASVLAASTKRYYGYSCSRRFRRKWKIWLTRLPPISPKDSRHYRLRMSRTTWGEKSIQLISEEPKIKEILNYCVRPAWFYTV